MQETITIKGFGISTLFASGLYLASREAGWDARLNYAACRSVGGAAGMNEDKTSIVLKEIRMEESSS